MLTRLVSRIPLVGGGGLALANVDGKSRGLVLDLGSDPVMQHVNARQIPTQNRRALSSQFSPMHFFPSGLQRSSR